MTSGEAPRTRDTPMMTPEAARLKQKAESVVASGLVMATAPTLEELMVPPPRIITEKAAPKAAAWEMPKVKGEPSGLRRMDCITAPATASPAPATMEARAWGRRMFQMIMSKRLDALCPNRLFMTAGSGTSAAPREMDTTRAAISASPVEMMNTVFRPM